MNEVGKILIVDDDPDILEFLHYNLKRESYSVLTASNGREGIDRAVSFNPDIILLDLMMPEMDGIAACREMRKKPELAETYIIFLTARIEEFSEIAGFSAGADDYINKPIKPGALISRIKSIFSRRKKSSEQTALSIKDLNIDRTTYDVEYKGERMHFARKEFELLYMLASHPGKVFKREQILEEIWGNDVYVGDRTIDVHIRKIREKINPDYIRTIKGIGYKFELNA